MDFNVFLQHHNIYNEPIFQKFQNFNHSIYSKEVPNWSNVLDLLSEHLEDEILENCNGFSWIQRIVESNNHLIETKLMCFGMGDFQLTRTDRRKFDKQIDLQIIMSVLGDKIYFDCFNKTLNKEKSSCGLLTFSDQNELISLDTIYNQNRRHFDVSMDPAKQAPSNMTEPTIENE